MAAPHVSPDGNIQAAIRDLAAAVNTLLDPVTRIANDAKQIGPSPYEQLRVATQGTQSQSGTGGGGKSRPPMWTEAFDLLAQIDDAVGAWNPGHCCQPATACRLRCITTRRWRPQDTVRVQKITGILQAWATSIDALFDPHHKMHLKTACPMCGEKFTYRPDAAGETVRVPALTIDAILGCTCLVCGAFWAPQQFKKLATQVLANEAADAAQIEVLQ